VAHLLVVDDDRDVADLLAEAVGSGGHEVRVANDGEQGLALVAGSRPDLVLLDVEMPLLNGPDMAYRMFVRDCGDEKIPIVLLSGAMGLRDAAAVVGTPYFLAKPYTLDALNTVMARALAERKPPHPRVNNPGGRR
jgi:CheY-like chemotaxis protein